MPRRTDSRSRMIHAAAELFRQRGYHATTFSDVVRDSGAPRGSTYFHFPGGKHELAREAIARAGDEVEEMVDEAARHADEHSLWNHIAQGFNAKLAEQTRERFQQENERLYVFLLDQFGGRRQLRQSSPCLCRLFLAAVCEGENGPCIG